MVDDISIHTPVKGVTCAAGYPVGDRADISIHTPVKGVTSRSGSPSPADIVDFNPHTREGCDIPAPQITVAAGGDFNPHTREGCDAVQLYVRPAFESISIHTPVKGVTRRVRASRNHNALISIHTPVKGVTLLPLSLPEAVLISIHTPVKGVTQDLRGALGGGEISIHTPVKGVTELPRVTPNRWKFQSTHP